jgi:RNA polymerase sigma-70 factor, ECF subfamily
MPDFHDLLEPQIPRLRRYSRALTRDTQRADDLVQDTLVRALMKQDRWEPGTNLRAWLFTLMHNQYVNNVRRANREAGTIDIDDVSSSLVATTDPTASRQLYELERALGQLAAEQREASCWLGLKGSATRTPRRSWRSRCSVVVGCGHTYSRDYSALPVPRRLTIEYPAFSRIHRKLPLRADASCSDSRRP